MLFHTMVGSNDIERSKRFYDTVLGTLGAGEGTRNIADSGHTRLIYNNGNGTNFIVSQPINDEPASVANGETASMGTIELAYFRDPDGNKLCGIHFPA